MAAFLWDFIIKVPKYCAATYIPPHASDHCGTGSYTSKGSYWHPNASHAKARFSSLLYKPTSANVHLCLANTNKHSLLVLGSRCPIHKASWSTCGKLIWGLKCTKITKRCVRVWHSDKPSNMVTHQAKNQLRSTAKSSAAMLHTTERQYLWMIPK